MSAEEYAKADENYWREKYKLLEKCLQNSNSCQDYIDSVLILDGTTSSTCLVESKNAPYDINSERTLYSFVYEDVYKDCVGIGKALYRLGNYVDAIEYFKKKNKTNLFPHDLLDFYDAYFQMKQYAKAYVISNYGCQKQAEMYGRIFNQKVDKDMQEMMIENRGIGYDNILLLCNNKAVSMFHGQGTRQNQTEAIKIVKNICDTTKRHELLNGAIGMGCKYVGNMYADLQNLSLAKEYYGKACDLGDDEACEKYRILNQQGIKAPSEMPKPATKQSTVKSATAKPDSKSQAK